MKILLTLLGCVLSTALAGCQTAVTSRASYRPSEGYVPDADTAVRIAEAVWLPIYGKKQIESERPFKAKLFGGVWTVTGSLPEGWKGGTAEIDISKSDGTVLRVIHGK